MRTGEANIEKSGEQYGAVPVSSLRPQPIPIRLKVVMVGTPFLYALLQYYDPEFQKMFKIKADFDTDMERTAEGELKMAQFVARCLKRENGLPFEAGAVAEVIDWAARIADDQHRISTEFSKISDIIVESLAWAKAEGAPVVTDLHVRKAVEQKIPVKPRPGKDIQGFRRRIIRIDTSGSVVGQDQRPVGGGSMDSASTPVENNGERLHGAGGVVNIEREAGHRPDSPASHPTSYLGRKYA